MNEHRRASGFGSSGDDKLGVSVHGDSSGQSRQLLSDRDEFSKEEQRILDALERGLSRAFPNPDRIGCPGSAVLKGIAFQAGTRGSPSMAGSPQCLQPLLSGIY